MSDKSQSYRDLLVWQTAHALYQFILAHDLCYTDTVRLQDDLEEVSRLLQGYMNGLDRTDA